MNDSTNFRGVLSLWSQMPQNWTAGHLGFLINILNTSVQLQNMIVFFLSEWKVNSFILEEDAHAIRMLRGLEHLSYEDSWES